MSCHCLAYHKEEIQADILQAWAEAKYLYDKGELQPYADRNLLEEIKAKQEQAVEDDYRVGMISDYLSHKYKDKVCIMELWKYALNNEYSKPTRRESNEITLILQSLGGWERGKVERHNEFGNQMFWYRKKEIELPPINDEDFTVLPYKLSYLQRYLQLFTMLFTLINPYISTNYHHFVNSK